MRIQTSREEGGQAADQHPVSGFDSEATRFLKVHRDPPVTHRSVFNIAANAAAIVSRHAQREALGGACEPISAPTMV
jgi:hypothetical protein